MFMFISDLEKIFSVFLKRVDVGGSNKKKKNILLSNEIKSGNTR